MMPSSPAWPTSPITSIEHRIPYSAPSQGKFAMRRMAVKIHYTLDGPHPFSVIARLEPRNLPTVARPQVGLIDLKSCIDKVLESSPELRPRVKHDDYTIYVTDYSEEDHCFVSQGPLSSILSGQSSSAQAGNRIVGRICKSLSLMGNGSSETLEIRLKFVPCPPQPVVAHNVGLESLPLDNSVSQPGVDNAAWANINDFLQDPISMQNLDDASSIFADEGISAALDDLEQHFTPVATPLGQVDDYSFGGLGDSESFRESSPISAMLSGLSAQRTYSNVSRPQSSMSMRSNLSNQSLLQSTEVETFEDANPEDQRHPKRARLMQVSSKPRGTVFAASKGPLRQTATAAASIRNFRPGPEGLQQQARQSDGANRAPTPRPQRYRNSERRQSGLARSALRQESSFTSPTPQECPEPLWNPSSDCGLQELTSELNHAESPLDFPSSPPVLPFDIYEDANRPSSPLPEALLHGTGPDDCVIPSDSPEMFQVDILQDADLRAVANEGGLTNVPLPASDSGFFSDSQGLRTPVQKVPQDIEGRDTPQLEECQGNDLSIASNRKRQMLRQNRIKNFPWQNNAYGDVEKLPRSMKPPSRTTLSRAQSATGVSAWSHDLVQPGTSPAPDRPIGLERSLTDAGSTTTTNRVSPAIATQPVPSNGHNHTLRRSSSGFAFPELICSSPAPSVSEAATPTAFSPVSSCDAGSPRSECPQDERALTSISGNARYKRPSTLAKDNCLPQPEAGSTLPEPRGVSQSRKRSRCGSKGPTLNASTGSQYVAMKGATPIAPAPTKDHNAKPASDAPAAMDDGSERISQLKRERIRSARNEAVKAGRMPRFCAGCGILDTPTWRKVYSRRRSGPPPYGREKSTGYYPISTDAWGKVTEHMMYKRNINKEERASESFKEHVLCNSCGIHFSNCGRMRIPIIDPPDDEAAAKQDDLVVQTESHQRVVDKENVPPSFSSTVNLAQSAETDHSAENMVEQDRSGYMQSRATYIDIEQLTTGEDGSMPPSDALTLQELEMQPIAVQHARRHTSAVLKAGHTVAGTNSEDRSPKKAMEERDWTDKDIPADDDDLFGPADGLALLGVL